MFHLLRNKALLSTPPSAPPTQPSMEDTPESIVVYHDQDGEMEAMAQRAESLHINNGHASTTQTQELPTRTINPAMGHMEGANLANNLAVFCTFGPDRPDPPLGRGGGSSGGGGGRGGGGRGGSGGPPPPGPRGIAAAIPLPGTLNYLVIPLLHSMETKGKQRPLQPNGTS